MIDYYQILGVIPDAETAVIKAAYRAMAGIYHPDKNPDPAAQEKMKIINEAYDVLSDPVKKKEYDESRATEQNSANAADFDHTTPFEEDPHEKKWAIALSFYPDMEDEYKHLERISWRLAFAFQLKLLESKNFQESNVLAKKIKQEYLVRYFGKDKGIIDYAEQLIISGEIKAALHLNEIVNVMGESVNFWAIKDVIETKFPDVTKKLHGLYLYKKVKLSNYTFEKESVKEFVELHGGSIHFGVWNNKIHLEMDGNEVNLEGNDELRKYLINRFSKIYNY